MSADEEVTMPTELVIIKRRAGGGDEGHHGGAWKIAYADFMTAMMAFFLVMWLINSSDDKSKKQLANYFNPIELNDKLRSTKGLNDIEADATVKEHSGKKSKAAKGGKPAPGKPEPGKPAPGDAMASEQELFTDPGRVLDDLAREAKQNRNRLQGSRDAGQAGSPGAGEGDALRDPFAPAFLSKPLETAPASKAASRESRGARGSRHKAAGRIAQFSPGLQVKILNEPRERQLKAEINHAMRDLAKGAAPFIDVTQTAEGLLISITDEFDFGMFAIASARPRPELVLVMEKLAGVLKKRKEQMVIRGHTDGRPFKSKVYDNWRLSTARAHVARLMLGRGGVREMRFARVEGHADHHLRVATNPKAARNRRIEILLVGPKR